MEFEGEMSEESCVTIDLVHTKIKIWLGIRRHYISLNLETPVRPKLNLSLVIGTVPILHQWYGDGDHAPPLREKQLPQ